MSCVSEKVGKSVFSIRAAKASMANLVLTPHEAEEPPGQPIES